MTIRSVYRFARVPEWILFHESLDGLDTRVYAVLDRFDGEGGCFPGLARVGEIVQKSEDTVRRSIRKLEAIGAVVATPRFVEGRQTTNDYELAGDEPLHTRPCVCATPGGGTHARDEGRADARAYREPEERKPEERKAAPRDSDDRFNEFWSKYPRRTAKVQAMKAWKRLKADDQRAAIDGIDPFIAGLANRELRFIPHPATYLNNQRWTDEPVTKPAKPAEVRPFNPDEFMRQAYDEWLAAHDGDAGTWLTDVRGYSDASDECVRRMEAAGMKPGGLSTKVHW